MAIFKKPRVIVDWVNIDDHQLPNIFSQELFFNICFSALYGNLRAQFVVDKDMFGFVREFLLIWTVIVSASDYATRFNDDDAFHTIWWAGFGAGLVGILMHLQNQLHYALALTHLWVAMTWFRVAFELKQCRRFSLLYGTSLVILAASIMTIGVLDLKDTWLSLAPALIQPVVKTSVVNILKHDQHIPLNIDYHLPKFQGLGMVIMGQLVVVAATPPRTGTGPHDKFTFYRDGLCAVLLLVSFKLIVTDCDSTTADNHAIRRSKWSALLWLFVCQPGLNLFVVLCSAGVSLIHVTNNTGNPEGLDSGIKLVSGSSAGMFLSFLGKQLLHKREKVVSARPDLQRYKAIWLSALFSSALICTVPALFDVNPMPTIAVVALITANIGWLCKRAVVSGRKMATSVALDLPIRRTSSLPTLTPSPSGKSVH